jgi:ubiquinone/menaquinone biosynthesis C-methylase UbiE
VSTSRDAYAPGWNNDAVTMMASRVATERAAFTLPFLRDGMHLLDVGCGPGSLSVGLAEAVAPHGELLGYDTESSQVRTAQATCLASGIVNARFEVASAYELPVKDETIEVYFSHAMFEHLSRPDRALAEAYRVLRPGGALAIAVSDWSRARIEPQTGDVALAMQGHYALRRGAGGDPFAGSRVATWARNAGFEDISEATTLRVDLSYDQLAAYVHARLHTAAREAPVNSDLHDAEEAAARWAGTTGSAQQCWVEITARKPSQS